MNIITISVLLILGLLVLVTYAWNRSAVQIGSDDFSDEIRSLLITTENGSFCRFDHVGSDIWFSFERHSGSDTSAILALRIPKRQWTESIADDLRKGFESHGFDYESEKGSLSLLAQVQIPVDNIWDKNCGVRGSHAARLLLNALGLGPSARFTFKTLGEGSRRLIDNKELRERL